MNRKRREFLSRLLNASCSDVITAPLFFSLTSTPSPPRPRPLSSFDKHVGVYVCMHVLRITGVQASGVIIDRLLRQCCFVWSEIVGSHRHQATSSIDRED